MGIKRAAHFGDFLVADTAGQSAPRGDSGRGISLAYTACSLRPTCMVTPYLGGPSRKGKDELCLVYFLANPNSVARFLRRGML